MLKKIINIFCLASFFVFVILTTTFYFSDHNIRKINKSRSFYSAKLINNTQNIPLLKNDTEDIIEYIDGIEIYKKKKKKYTFWNLIGK
jgi:hypothetical protein